MIDQLTSLHLPHISCLIWLIVTTIENNPIFLQLAMMCCLMPISVNPRDMLLFSFLHKDGNIWCDLLSCRSDTSCFVTEVRSNRLLWSVSFSVRHFCYVILKPWTNWLSSYTHTDFITILKPHFLPLCTDSKKCCIERKLNKIE